MGYFDLKNVRKYIYMRKLDQHARYLCELVTIQLPVSNMCYQLPVVGVVLLPGAFLVY